jgi:hypothetical protein
MKMLISVLLLVSASAVAQQEAPKISADPKGISVTVDLTGSPLTGTCPYNMNLSWTASNASVCTKSGAWSGTGSASGSESISVNAASQTYTLTCSSSTESKTLTWVNPTQNTDGSAAVLANNKVYHANSAANLESSTPIVLTPAKTTYVVAGLPAGPRSFAVKAGTATVDSAMSAVASTTIVLPTGADTVQAGCTTPPEPKPPTAVTISSTVWDTKGSVQGGSLKVGTNVGGIDLGVLCRGQAPVITEGFNNVGQPVEYWELDKNLTRIRPGVKPRPGILVGQCQLQPVS